MKLGIIGLPNVGKSTLFNSLTNSNAQCENYPFCTIEPNIGMVNVKDYRVDKLFEMHKPEKLVYAAINFVDIAGLVKGASKGEGLGNKFLSNIREVDSIIHVVRCFNDDNIVHVDGSVNPIRDVEIINLELILSDIEMLEKKIEKTKKISKSGNKEHLNELAFLIKLRDYLESGKPARTFEVDEEDENYMKELFLLTTKPIIYVANILEDDLYNQDNNNMIKDLTELAANEEAKIIKVCAKLEDEISKLSSEEKTEFLEELGLKSSGLDKLIKTSYDLLGLISYFTYNEKEVHAWNIKNGTKAPQAAGKIHSDFEKKFIKAEVINFDKFVTFSSYSEAKDSGAIRIEGKEYVVNDGDVILFKI